MDPTQLFIWLHDTTFATAIRESDLLFPWIESVHVLAIALVVGSIFIVDLRLLGLASGDRSVSSVTAAVLPFTWSAFAFAVVTGAAMFSSHAVGYAHNLQFQLKLLLLVFAGINMLAFHRIMRHDRQRYASAGSTPRAGKIAGLISLFLWVGIVAFGRWIGFEAVR